MTTTPPPPGGYPGQPWHPPATGPYAPPPPGGPRRGRTPAVVTAIVVVLALVAAGVIVMVGRQSQQATGAASPTEAVADLMAAVGDADPVGIADTLDPAEGHLAADIGTVLLDELKRLQIIRPDIDTAELLDTSLSLTDVSYGTPITINDHVRVVALTGGTIEIGRVGPEELTGILTDRFTDHLPDRIAELQQGLQHRTGMVSDRIDIADINAHLGRPFRLATVERDGTWFASMLYTIADNTAYQQFGPDYPSLLGQPIPDRGAASPEAAMDDLISAISRGSLTDVVGLLSPDAMRVIHDYAPLVFRDSPELQHQSFWGPDVGDILVDNGISITRADWTVSDVTGGRAVSLGTLELDSPVGPVSIERDVAAARITVSTPYLPTMILDADDLDLLRNAFGLRGPEAQVLERGLTSLLDVGVVMTRADDGLWYVDPLRTVSDAVAGLLRALEPADIDHLLRGSR